jgi:pimeloyl-ACP methyl ester carboxylesterase
MNKTMLLGLGLCLCVTMQAQTERTVYTPYPCPNTFTFHGAAGQPMVFRYGSNMPLEARNERIRHLIVTIHGASRNGLDYYNWSDTALTLAGKNAETLLIAPQFASEADLNQFGQDKNHLFWASNSWRSGYESTSTRKRPMPDSLSSFSIVDTLIWKAATSGLFPKLKKITVIGHSAGGQFVQRYVAMTPLPNLLKNQRFQFVVMNSSSYMYFDNKRPQKNASGQLTFAPPADAAACADFNTYPKGLEKLNRYATRTGKDNLQQQFRERNIVFIMGTADTSTVDPSLDKTCSAKMQGAFRLERGQNFHAYLKHFYHRRRLFDLFLVPDVNHNGRKMLQSKQALRRVFSW